MSYFHHLLGGTDPGYMISQPTTAAFVQVPNNALLQLTGAMSFDIWVHPTTMNRAGLTAKGFNEFALNLEFTGSNFAGISFYQGGSAAANTANNMTGGMAANVGTHLRVTRSAPVGGVYTIKLYVNGVLTDTRTISVAPVLSTSSVNMGRRDSASTNLVGHLTETRYWNIECSAAHTTNTWNRRITAPETGLVACYPGITSGTSVIDIINGLNGTLQGGAVRADSIFTQLF